MKSSARCLEYLIPALINGWVIGSNEVSLPRAVAKVNGEMMFEVNGHFLAMALQKMVV